MSRFLFIGLEWEGKTVWFPIWFWDKAFGVAGALRKMGRTYRWRWPR